MSSSAYAKRVFAQSVYTLWMLEMKWELAIERVATSTPKEIFEVLRIVFGCHDNDVRTRFYDAVVYSNAADRASPKSLLAYAAENYGRLDDRYLPNCLEFIGMVLPFCTKEDIKAVTPYRNSENKALVDFMIPHSDDEPSAKRTKK